MSAISRLSSLTPGLRDLHSVFIAGDSSKIYIHGELEI
jgi:hypothetical protein